MFRYSFVFLLGLIMSVILIKGFRRLALRSKMFVCRDVAVVGGVGLAIASVLASLLALMLFGDDPGQYFFLMLVSLAMLIFGVMDDLKEATVVQKVLLQSLCAVLLIAVDVRTHIIWFGFWGNCLITFLWIVGVTNAFNLLDIMDGLSPGVALIATVALLSLSFLYPDVSTQLFLLGLAGALLGVFLFNVPPAKVYLGNAGSHFLGFILAAVAIKISYASHNNYMALLSPVIVLWLPLLETACLFLFRIEKGIAPFNKSDDHIALRLTALGLSRQRALLLLLSLAFLFGLGGVGLSTVNAYGGAGIIVAVLAASFILFGTLKRAGVNGA